jgi:hypothetical protein
VTIGESFGVVKQVVPRSGTVRKHGARSAGELESASRSSQVSVSELLGALITARNCRGANLLEVSDKTRVAPRNPRRLFRRSGLADECTVHQRRGGGGAKPRIIALGKPKRRAG